MSVPCKNPLESQVSLTVRLNPQQSKQTSRSVTLLENNVMFNTGSLVTLLTFFLKFQNEPECVCIIAYDQNFCQRSSSLILFFLNSSALTGC